MFLLAQAITPTEAVNPWLPQLVSLGGFGLLLFLCLVLVWAFITRRIVPGGQYEEMKEDRDLQRQRGDKQSERADNAEARSDLYLEQSKVTIHLLESLNRPSQQRELG